MRYKISTPDADEYKEIVICVNNIGYIVGGKYDGKVWDGIQSDLISSWKLHSSKYNDNVYPTVEREE